MKVARFVLKIVALSLTTAAVVCAVIAYWIRWRSSAAAPERS